MIDPSQSSNESYFRFTIWLLRSHWRSSSLLQMNGKIHRCSRCILIFRSDNLVDFLSRFLIVNRPCELGPLESLLTMQLCGSTSRFIRFQGDLLSLRSVMVNEPFKSRFPSRSTRSMCHDSLFMFAKRYVREGVLPWNWIDWLYYSGEGSIGSMLSTALFQRFLWVNKSKNRWHFCQLETTITHIVETMKIITNMTSTNK